MEPIETEVLDVHEDESGNQIVSTSMGCYEITYTSFVVGLWSQGEKVSVISNASTEEEMLSAIKGYTLKNHDRDEVAQAIEASDDKHATRNWCF